MGLKIKGLDVLKLLGSIEEIADLVQTLQAAIDKGGPDGQNLTDDEWDAIFAAVAALVKSVT